MAKPTPKQRQIARDLRRILCGNDNPTEKELARCRPRHVSGERVGDMYGYPTYSEVPNEFCDAVCEAGYAICIAIACGYRTIIVGGDFSPPTS